MGRREEDRREGRGAPSLRYRRTGTRGHRVSAVQGEVAERGGGIQTMGSHPGFERDDGKRHICEAWEGSGSRRKEC